MKCIIIFTILVFNSSVNGGELWEDIKKGTSDISSTVKKNLAKNEDRKLREEKNISINLNLSPINVPFPMAWGINGYYIVNRNWMVGLDYLNSSRSIGFFSIEFGEIKENIYTVQARRFFGNSFNVKFGVGQRSTEVKFVKNLFDLVTHNYSETASKFETKFIRLGIGNKWHFRNRYTLAIDWFSVDIPFSGEVVTSASQFAKAQEDKDDIKNAESLLKYYPSGGIIKFDIGVVF